jgi:hypothetical protein
MFYHLPIQVKRSGAVGDDEQEAYAGIDVEALRSLAAQTALNLDVLRPSLTAITSSLDALGPSVAKMTTSLDLVNLGSISRTLDLAISTARIADLGTLATESARARVLALPMLNVTETLQAILASQNRAVEDALAALRTSFDLSGAFRFTEQFAEYLRNLPPAEWVLAGRLESRGWWLVPGMDEQLMDALGDATDPGESGNVGALIVEYYTARKGRRLSALVRRWNLTEFRQHGRPTIFRQALRALRRGDFALATLALTMQIEGIVKDFLCDEKLIDVAVQRSGKNPVPLIRAHLTSENEPYFSGYVRDLEALYARYAGPSTRRRQPNRHGLAHGGEVPANSASELVRAFLRLQTLHFHLTQMREGRKAHVA